MPERKVSVISELVLRGAISLEKTACMAYFAILCFWLKYCDDKCMIGMDS